MRVGVCEGISIRIKKRRSAIGSSEGGCRFKDQCQGVVTVRVRLRIKVIVRVRVRVHVRDRLRVRVNI